ncbi:RNA-directed DNA polymerase, partial [Piscirickettsia salmonis]|uniref:RNA-directed DNA polymerase n=1 Tax=Piscirickettsia salmonis TaxID=1238 RepID=UPI003EB83425
NLSNFGDTDIFPFPFETRMFPEVQDELINSLTETHNSLKKHLNDVPPENVSTCSTIGYTGYRWATQIDQYWNIYFLGLILFIGDKIESARLDRNYVYSYRYKPNITQGSLFDYETNWIKFQEDSLHLTTTDDSINFIINCDIADFYTRIYHHRLENELDHIDKSASTNIKKLIQKFSNTHSYGLPVGGPASRILAELALNQTDKFLQSKNIKFKRYVDDFIIFCQTKEEAHTTLTLLSKTLMENEGLTLQKYKTSIMSKDEFSSLTQAKLNGVNEDDDSPLKAKFMKLPIRFDPYSQNAEKQYDSIKESLKEFDLLGMLTSELQKSKINQTFSKQLIRALSSTDDKTLSNAFTVIFTNIVELFPIFPRIIQVATTNWLRFDNETKTFIREKLVELFKNNSFILKTEINLAYLVKLISKDKSLENEQFLTSIYDKNTESALITSMVTQSMTKFQSTHWLRTLKSKFHSMNKRQKRIYIVASYCIGDDEGKHWRNHNRDSFNFIEKLYSEWAAKRKQSCNLEDAL